MKSPAITGILVALIMVILLSLASIKNNHPKDQSKPIEHQYNISINQNKPDTALIYNKEGIVFIKIRKQFYRAKIQ